MQNYSRFMPPELVGWLDSLNRIVSAGYTGQVTQDTEQLLGRQPIGFAQFAREHAASWR